jgi:hypothetical protein
MSNKIFPFMSIVSPSTIMNTSMIHQKGTYAVSKLREEALWVGTGGGVIIRGSA